MSIFHRIRMWLGALFRRARVEHDLDREMRLHLEMEVEENLRRGMSPDDARRRAMLAFGGVERHKESQRDQRGTRFLENLAADLRIALRGLRSNRGFALVTDTAGHAVTSAQMVTPGKRLGLRFADGEARVVAEGTAPRKPKDTSAQETLL